MAGQNSLPSSSGLTFNAGRLRHRIMIQQKVETQNQSTGEVTYVWQNLTAKKLAAEIAPSSTREFIASAAFQSEIVARIVIRWRADVTAKMRVVHTLRGVDRYYNIEGILPDPKSGVEWLTMPCSQGVNDG